MTAGRVQLTAASPAAGMKVPPLLWEYTSNSEPCQADPHFGTGQQQYSKSFQKSLAATATTDTSPPIPALLIRIDLAGLSAKSAGPSQPVGPTCQSC
jgi:hypothetical protein